MVTGIDKPGQTNSPCRASQGVVNRWCCPSEKRVVLGRPIQAVESRWEEKEANTPAEKHKDDPCNSRERPQRKLFWTAKDIAKGKADEIGPTSCPRLEVDIVLIVHYVWFAWHSWHCEDIAEPDVVVVGYETGGNDVGDKESEDER